MLLLTATVPSSVLIVFTLSLLYLVSLEGCISSVWPFLGNFTMYMFVSLSTVCQLYQDDGRVIMNGSKQKNALWLNSATSGIYRTPPHPHPQPPASILYKSIAGRYRPVSYPDGPITARYRFIKNAYWVGTSWSEVGHVNHSVMQPLLYHIKL